MSCEDAPPSPPEGLEELLSYVFEHAGDEDPIELAQGVVELHAWYQDDQNLEAGREGFVITKLSAEALESLQEIENRETPRSNGSLRGVHVVTKSPHCVRSIMGLLTWDQFGDLLESFDSYERTFESDTACLIDQSCLSVIAHSDTSSKWIRLIEINTQYQIEFRWVYTEIGWALVHRFWLKDPAIGSSYDVKMNANYYIGVTIPDAARAAAPPSPAFVASAAGNFGGSDAQLKSLLDTLKQPGSLRIHANWFDVDTGTIPVPDESIANLLVQNQKNDSQSHDDMINNNDAPGKCEVEADPTEEMMGAMMGDLSNASEESTGEASAEGAQ